MDFLTAVYHWLGPEHATVYAIPDNLIIHHAPDVLLFAARHLHWAFVYHPTYAAYLNPTAPWWKTVRSLALKGRRFATWEAICWAVDRATPYWNGALAPLRLGLRRQHRSRCKLGIALAANVRCTHWPHHSVPSCARHVTDSCQPGSVP